MFDTKTPRPVLILGAGVNGCAVARELILNGIPVTIVDVADIASGATAKSSRLIHGGLRYLEYADVSLVSESLDERERQLRLAPQFVKPLRLHIPIRHRLGGLAQAGVRFTGLTRFSVGRLLSSSLPFRSERGLLAVRFGLWLYDKIARSSLLPSHTVQRVQPGVVPAVDTQKYGWICSYSDAQMQYPERFVIALLKDARHHADTHGIPLEILTYHQVAFEGDVIRIQPVDRPGRPDPAAAGRTIDPSIIINATGAWGDRTLAGLGVPAGRLFGGTKGSHIVTRHAGLRRAIADGGIYAESNDGRLVFVLPLADATLIGTTDLRFDESPDEAIATPDEVAYLVEMVNSVFSDVHLSVDDVQMHYCGVRPLPYAPSGKTSSIPRGHSIHTAGYHGRPLLTLIGGKLTTWRAFGEEVADRVLRAIDAPRIAETTDRPIPGAVGFPFDESAWCCEMAEATGHRLEEVEYLLTLMGTDARMILMTAEPSDDLLPKVPISARVVREIIETEWVHCLEDLVERRLAVVFTHELTIELLERLAEILCEAGRLDPGDRQTAVATCRDSLTRRYGICWKSPATFEK